MAFWGFVALGTTIKGQMVTRNGSGTPQDASVGPNFRVYGPNGLMNNGTGSLLLKDPAPTGGTITLATNDSPIVITSIGHKLTTGTRVTVQNVGGNTSANGDWQVTFIDANTFSLLGSTGNNPYTSGGTWHVTGLYEATITPQGTDGYVQGTTYSVLVTATVAGTVVADIHTFTVV